MFPLLSAIGLLALTPVVMTTVAESATLLVGGGPAGTVSAVAFDGASFTVIANNTIQGTAASWLLFRENSVNLYAVDENSNTMRLFDFDASTNAISLRQTANGSSGVVSLAFNADRTRMASASFGAGALNFWDVGSLDGSMVLLQEIASDDALGPNLVRQDAPHPHQVQIDPSGRFFVANDLGTDTVLVVGADGDNFSITTHFRVDQPGCGPRHGAFFPPGASIATHYILLCEMLNLVNVLELSYRDDSIQFTTVQVLSTFGPDFPPVNLSSSTAGEIQVSPDGRDVYVSNRNTGNETDSISHFAAVTGNNGSVELEFRGTISSGGLVPRMISLGLDGLDNVLFATNQDGAFGLAAFSRREDGSLDSEPLASLPLSVFGSAGQGPQFVQEVRI